MARRQMELSNEVAAELAGSQDLILRTLEEHLECDVFLRGNVITLDGEADAVQAAHKGAAERGGPPSHPALDPEVGKREALCRRDPPLDRPVGRRARRHR